MNENVLRTLFVGAAGLALLSAALLVPAVASTAKPVLRRGMKAAVKAYVQGREALAEVQELAEDAYAEAWAELKAEASAATPEAAAAPAAAATTAAERPSAATPKRARRRRAEA